ISATSAAVSLTLIAPRLSSSCGSFDAPRITLLTASFASNHAIARRSQCFSLRASSIAPSAVVSAETLKKAGLFSNRIGTASSHRNGNENRNRRHRKHGPGTRPALGARWSRGVIRLRDVKKAKAVAADASASTQAGDFDAAAGFGEVVL